MKTIIIKKKILTGKHWLIPIGIVSVLLASLFSCTTVPQEPTENIPPQEKKDTEPPKPEEQSILLTFGGDIMAHNVNFNMNDYSLIYEDIAEILQSDDLSFANLETPVSKDRDYETYPTFNVRPPYADAAAAAGFDVFSLANNHSNDQGTEGMLQTAEYFKSKTASGVYAAGIKEAPNGPLSYRVIEKNGWKILFAAVTEILNSRRHIEYLDYIEPEEGRRARFREELRALREQNPCDIFVLSLHTCEPEYKKPIAQERREFYYSLLESGVDIVWANHPHIAKEWEVITDSASGHTGKMIMYALGNTISGQRTKPNFADPAAEREYTGDGYLIQVQFKKTKGVPEDIPSIEQITPIAITTHIDPHRNFVIRKLDTLFIEEFRQQGLNDYADYFTERLDLMQQIGERRTCR